MSMRVFSNGTRIAAIALVSFASTFASAKPNYDESKVPPYTLENPLTFADGRKVQTKSDWRRRRDEILDVFSREMYGQPPPVLSGVRCPRGVEGSRGYTALAYAPSCRTPCSEGTPGDGLGGEEIVVGRGKADANGESDNKGSLGSSLLPEKTTLVMGYHLELGAKAVNMGYGAVLCPIWNCYFDYDQQLPDDRYSYLLPGKRWLPLKNVYKFNPFDGVAEKNRPRILGGQCCNWTEKTKSFDALEWKLWPRALAIAEVLWTFPDIGKRDFAEFSRRAEIHQRRLSEKSVNCAPVMAPTEQ